MARGEPLPLCLGTSSVVGVADYVLGKHDEILWRVGKVKKAMCACHLVDEAFKLFS